MIEDTFIKASSFFPIIIVGPVHEYGILRMDNPSLLSNYPTNVISEATNIQGIMYPRDATLRRELFVEESLQHMSKNNLYQVQDLYRLVTKPGDTILDPMSGTCLLYTSPSPRDRTRSRMPSSA